MKIRNSRLGPFVILLALSTTATTAKENQNVFPGQAWERATPESQGLDPADLKDAIDYLHAHAGGVGADEMVVIRNGRLVWEGPAADNVHEIYSATKTFTSTVLGLLATDGLVDLDDPAVKYLPTIDDEFPQYRHVTLRQLATMTAGYDGALGDGWKYYATDRPKHLEHVLQYLRPGRPLFEPGLPGNTTIPRSTSSATCSQESQASPWRKRFESELPSRSG